MRLTLTAGPRPTLPLMLWPQAEMAAIVWVNTHGFPMKTQLITKPGWADVGPKPQWLEAGWTVVNECYLEKP